MAKAHFFPRCVLKRFVIPRRQGVLLYDKAKNELLPRPIKKIFQGDDLYVAFGLSQKLKRTGSFCADLEDEIGKIESHTGWALDDIESGVVPPSNIELYPRRRAALHIFVRLLAIRNPYCVAMDMRLKGKPDLAHFHIKLLDDDVSEYDKPFVEGARKESVDSLRKILAKLNEEAIKITPKNMGITILQTSGDENAFVTGSIPIACVIYKGRRMSWIPTSPNLALSFDGYIQKDLIIQCNSLVKCINGLIYKYSDLVVVQSREHLETVKLIADGVVAPIIRTVSKA